MGGLADRELARKLKEAPAALSRELREGLKKAAGPAADRARKAILGAETHHPGLLREHIASTVSVSAAIRTASGAQVTIKSDGKKMPPGQHNLAAYADGTQRPYNRWRHPTFGHDPWKTQEWPSARGWFDTSIRKELSGFASAAEDACDRVARKLNEGG